MRHPQDFLKDCYTAQDIPLSAPYEEIKKSYRRLARKHHPDVSKVLDTRALREDRFEG